MTMKKAVSKRIKVTKTGKIIRRSMGIGHNGSRKNKNRKRRIKGVVKVAGADIRGFQKELFKKNPSK